MSRTTVVNDLGLDRPVLEVARSLIGDVIVSAGDRGTCRGRIVETEAYSEDDPASHSSSGVTERSRVMFGDPGYWYVYKCYGIHWMTNVVCGEPGHGEAVLLRAVEPVQGIEHMMARRGVEGIEATNGPGKLSEALGVTGEDDGAPIAPDSGLYLEPGSVDGEVLRSPRVGIQEATERPWRFFLAQNQYVSRVKQNDASGR